MNILPKLDTKNMIKPIVIILIVLCILPVLLNIALGDFFKEQRETRSSENAIIEKELKNILENIYCVPVTLKLINFDRSVRLAGGPKLTYGNYIYEITFPESNRLIKIYWELNGDIPELKEIKAYDTDDVIWEAEVSTYSKPGSIDCKDVTVNSSASGQNAKRR
jgi:hypothetical protein